MSGELPFSGGVLFGLFFTPEPRVVGLVPLGLLAAVLFPLDVGLGPEDASAFLADILGHEEWPDIEADAVV